MSEENRRAEEDDRGPGSSYQMFVVMEDLLDKLKLLNYEEEVLRKNNMKSLSRHYFALPTNPGEQFFMFTAIAAWLINKAGSHFEQPQEYDDPNATVSNILMELRKFGGVVDFPPSKLKAGNGEHVCYVLDRLAEEALKQTRFIWNKPKYPSEAPESETVMEDDAELTLEKLEEEIAHEDPDDYEDENVIGIEALKERSHKSEIMESSKPDEILESSTDATEWNLEVERVLPQLKVTIRTDNKVGILFARTHFVYKATGCCTGYSSYEFIMCLASYDEVVVVSYVPKKNKTVCVLSSQFLDDSVSSESRKKPNMILEYNRTKGGVDNADKRIFLCQTYLKMATEPFHELA
ncbi:IFT57 protein, partial [Polypterus senegalus]